MFASYKTRDGYGYMCFGGETKVSDNLLEYIQERVHDDTIKLLYVNGYSDYTLNYVWIHTDGLYQTILYTKTLKDVEDIGSLYSFLFRKYGFTNILGFLPCDTQKATNTS